ncbi:MAG: hypothetical protein ACO3S6_06350, partial [Aquiluna sp.]
EGGVRCKRDRTGGEGDIRLGAPEASEVGKRCEQLAELLECLDPELTQDAERFARTWRCQGTTILRLERDARHLRAQIPGEGAVDLIHEEDLADACLFLLENYDSSEHVNVGSGKDLSIRALAEMVAEEVGFTGETRWDITKPDGTPRKLLDVSKINELGWKATTGLREGIRNSIRDFESRRAELA